MGRLRRTMLVLTLLLSVLVSAAAACSSVPTTSASRPGSSTAVSQPPASGAPSTGKSAGTYVPASGTAPSGLLFEQYRSRALGYRLLYPGGWNVSHHGTTLRIAKFGNAIVVAVRRSHSAPKLKGVAAALKQQRKKGAILSVTQGPRLVALPAGKAVRVVFTQARASSATSARSDPARLPPHSVPR